MIVGVVKNVREAGLNNDPMPVMYIPAMKGQN